MRLKNFWAATAVAVATTAASMAPADASLMVYNSRAAFFGLSSHMSIDWGVYGPAGTGISTPDSRTVYGLTFHVSSSQGLLDRHDESTDYTGNFAIGDHLLTEASSQSDSFIVSFDSQTVYGFGMQVEPDSASGVWNGGIDVYDAANMLLGTVAINGNKTGAEDNTAPFYGILSPAGDIKYAVFWIDQSADPFLPPKAGDIAINRMDVLVPEPGTLALFGAALFGAVRLRRRSVR